MVRKQTERSHRDTLKLVIECLREERTDLLEDVGGNVAFIGGDRLKRYSELDSVIAYMEEQQLKHSTTEKEDK